MLASAFNMPHAEALAVAKSTLQAQPTRGNLGPKYLLPVTRGEKFIARTNNCCWMRAPRKAAQKRTDKLMSVRRGTSIMRRPLNPGCKAKSSSACWRLPLGGAAPPPTEVATPTSARRGSFRPLRAKHKSRNTLPSPNGSSSPLPSGCCVLSTKTKRRAL